MKIKTFLTAFAALVLLASVVDARIKLTAVPGRDDADIRLESGMDVLVEERRTLTLLKGANKVDFSWENVVIDPGSLLLTALDHPEGVRVINITYPANESNSLVWEVYSDRNGGERVSISYLIQNVGREFHYEARVGRNEKTMDMKLYAVIFNDSGEDYAKARLRQGVGRDIESGIASGEAKKLLIHEWKRLPVVKVFRVEQGEEMKAKMYYLLENVKKNGLGGFALPGGKMRIYQDDGRESTVFLGEDWNSVIPVGGKEYLYLAVAEDIKAERHMMSDEMENIRYKDAVERKEIASFDRRVKVKYELGNFKDYPVTLEVTENFNDYWKMVKSSHEYEKKDARTVEFRVDLPAKGKKTFLEFEILWVNQIQQ